jgi:hypothetical protein
MLCYLFLETLEILDAPIISSPMLDECVYNMQNTKKNLEQIRTEINETLLFKKRYFFETETE